MNIEKNTIYNCDCLELMDNMIKNYIFVDAIITYLPYLMDYKTSHRKDKNHKFCKEILYDRLKKCMNQISLL